MTLKLQKPRYTAAINVKCPWCGAEPGKPCFEDEPALFHTSRKTLAGDTRLRATIGDMLQAKR